MERTEGRIETVRASMKAKNAKRTIKSFGTELRTKGSERRGTLW